MTCHKLAYSSLHQAGEALMAISRIEDPRRRECGVHPCSTCHAWHLTSSNGAERNRWTSMALKRKRSSTLNIEPLHGARRKMIRGSTVAMPELPTP